MVDARALQRKLAAVGLLVVLLLMVYWLLIQPYVDSMNAYRDQIAGLQEQIQRFTKVIGQKEYYQKQLAVLTGNHKLKQNFIIAETTAMASATLQQKVKTLIGAKGGQLISTQVSLPPGSMLKTTAAAPAEKTVSINVLMRVSMDSLREIFYSLESGRPVLTIDNVSISKLHAGRRLNASANSNQDLLEVRYEITAYLGGVL